MPAWGRSSLRMTGVDAPHRNWLEARWECVSCHPLWRKVLEPAPAVGEAK